MTCRRADKLIAASLHGELSDAEAGALDRHLTACERCRDEYRRAETCMRQVAAVLTAPRPPAGLGEGIMAAVRAAADESRNAIQQPIRVAAPPRSRWTWLPRPAVAAATFGILAVTAAIALWFLRPRQHSVQPSIGTTPQVVQDRSDGVPPELPPRSPQKDSDEAPPEAEEAGSTRPVTGVPPSVRRERTEEEAVPDKVQRDERTPRPRGPRPRGDAWRPGQLAEVTGRAETRGGPPERAIDIRRPTAYGRVADTAGEAALRRKGREGWRSALAADALQPGDVLKTGAESSLVATFSDGSSLELAAGTEITLGAAPGGAKRPAGAELARGEIMVVIEPGGGPFEVGTPAGVASVTGTRFLLSTTADRTVLLVLEGAVEFHNELGQVTARKMERVETVVGEAPAAARPVSHVRWRGREWQDTWVAQAPDAPAEGDEDGPADAEAQTEAERQAEADALARAQGKSVPELIADLTDEVPVVRAAAATTLATLAELPPGSEAVEPATDALLEALQDDDARVRAQSANALRSLSYRADEAAAIRLATHLTAVLDDEVDDVRMHAFWALRGCEIQITDPATLRAMAGPFEKATEDPYFQVRKLGVIELANLLTKLDDRDETARVMPRLMQLLEDDHLWVRAAAAEAARKISTSFGNEELLSVAVETMKALLQQGDPTASVMAATSLLDVPGLADRGVSLEAILVVLVAGLQNEDRDVRVNVPKALSKAVQEGGPASIESAVQALADALEDPDRMVRYAAADALRGIINSRPTDDEAVIGLLAPLVAAMQDEEPAVRPLVVWALGACSGKITAPVTLRTMVEPLTQGLYDDYEHVRKIASPSLARVLEKLDDVAGAQRVMPRIVELLEDDHPHVRAMAARAVRILAAEFGDGPALEAAVATMHDLLAQDDTTAVFWAASELIEVAAMPDQEVDLYPAAVAVIGCLGNDSESTRRSAASTLALVAEKLEELAGAERIMPRVLELLDDDDPHVRARSAKAARILAGKLEDGPALEAAVATFYDLLDGDDPTARIWAADELVAVADMPGQEIDLDPAAATVIELLGSEDQSTCGSAASALGRLARKVQDQVLLYDALPSLVGVLQSPTASTRYRAGYAFAVLVGVLGDAEAWLPIVDPLVQRTKEDDDPMVRYYAASALQGIAGKRGDVVVARQAVAAYVWLMRNAPTPQRRYAAQKIGRAAGLAEDEALWREVVEVCMAAMQHEDAELRSKATNALGHMQPNVSDPAVFEPCVPLLIEAIAVDEGVPDDTAVWTLGRMAVRVHQEAAFAPAVPALCSVLAGEVGTDKLGAAMTLKTIAADTQDPALLQSMLEPLPAAQPEKATYLEWQLGEIYGHVIAKLPEGDARQAVAALLPYFAEEGLGPVGTAARAVRVAARRLGDDAILAPAIPLLIANLRREDASVVINAARALAQMDVDDPETLTPAIEALVDRLRDPVAEMRVAAAQSLGAVARAAREPEALERSVLPLTELLLDYDENVRWAAADALGIVATALHGGELLGLAAGSLADLLIDVTPRVRVASANALRGVAEIEGTAGPLSATIPQLSLALTDEEASVRWLAAAALAAIARTVTDPEAWDIAVPDLANALASDHPTVRAYAMEALRRIGGDDAKAAVDAHGDERQRTLAEERFDADDGGWAYWGDAYDMMHHADGGHPDGCLSAIGSCVSIPNWGFQAPAEFLGDKSAAYGGCLSFDRQQYLNESPAGSTLVILVGGDRRLVHNSPYRPGADWTSFSVPLHEFAGWARGATGGEPATRDDVLAVLSDLRALRIHGGVPFASDIGAIDNVVLTAGTQAAATE